MLIVSGSKALQLLLSRLLREQGHTTAAASDGDEAFSALQAARPAVVVLDQREADADQLLFHGLLRRRHPALPVLSLMAGQLRLCDGSRDVLLEPSGRDLRGPLPLLAALRRMVDEVAAVAALRAWNPAPGLA